MIPASFAPWLLKQVMPMVLELLIPLKTDIKKHSQYVDEPNATDLKVEKLEAQIKMLAEDQHPPVIDLEEWEDVKATIKKIKNKKAFKSLGK